MEGTLIALLGVTASSLGVLLPAFKVVQQMADTYGKVKFARTRCKAVIRRAALIIKGVHESAQKAGTELGVSHLKEFQKKLEEVQEIINKLAEMSFFKALLRFDVIGQEIDEADRHLSDCLQIFQIELLFRAQSEKDNAAKSDKAILQDILNKLRGDYLGIRRHFGIHSDEEEDHAMAAMETKLGQMDNTSQEAVEARIMKSSLECIRSSTGKQSPKLNDWLITEFDLDFGGMIGGGGFSTVRRAKYQSTMVAVKTLKDIGNMKLALEKEIDIWSRLRHDHIVPFYGACTLSSSPYIVCRYMKNGNLIKYLTRTSDANRTKLIYEISLGMLYLHSKNIVHGDLKGINVLVDDAGKACITDFGLSSFSSMVSTEATTDTISGTLRFLAPEALRGKPLNFSTDVYAFGMVIYEVFADEGPFAGIPDNEVRKGNLTLTRPPSSRHSARNLTDSIWQLCLGCTSSDPSERPLFSGIQKRLEPTIKEDLFSQTFNLASTEFPGNEHHTNWAYEPATSTSRTVQDSQAPLLKKEFSPEKPSFTSVTHDVENVRPVCAGLACTYFNVEFGLMKSREPGVYLEENDALEWQPLCAKKGSLVREEGNQFIYRRRIGEGSNSWELDGNKVILHSSSIDAVCSFRDVQTARNWFQLQLSYARNGNVGSWGASNVKGDWSTTTQGWRRIVGGKFQQADPLEEAPSLTPSSWRKVELLPRAKRYTIDSSDRDSNSITCIVNPGSSRTSQFCCKIQGRKLIFTTSRLSVSQTPTITKEETYPTENDAQVMFDVVKMTLGKGSDKKQKHESRLFF